jgi:hypothetical protein
MCISVAAAAQSLPPILGEEHFGTLLNRHFIAHWQVD